MMYSEDETHAPSPLMSEDHHAQTSHEPDPLRNGWTNSLSAYNGGNIVSAETILTHPSNQRPTLLNNFSKKRLREDESSLSSCYFDGLNTMPFAKTGISNNSDIIHSEENGWETFVNEEGHPYYYNFYTGESMWASNVVDCDDADPESNGRRHEITDGSGESNHSWNPTAALELIRKSRRRCSESWKKKNTSKTLKKKLKTPISRKKRRRQRRKIRKIMLEMMDEQGSDASIDFGAYGSSSEDEEELALANFHSKSDLCVPHNVDIEDGDYGEGDDEFDDDDSMGDADVLDSVINIAQEAMGNMFLWKNTFVSKYVASNATTLSLPEIIASVRAVALLAVEWTQNHMLPNPSRRDEPIQE